MKPFRHSLPSGDLVQPLVGRAVTGNDTAKALFVDEAARPGFELKHLLVPVDFSETSLQALRYAVPLARQFGAALSLVHVVEKTSLVTDLSRRAGSVLREEVAALGVRVLTNLRQRELGPDFPGETLVRTGEPAQAIAQAAQELGADLIVLGIRAGRGLKHVLLADGAELILRHAPCPVLSLHPHPKSVVRSRVAAIKRWFGELSCRLAFNRYVFYGSLLLAASLVVGALTGGDELWWRTAAALGVAAVIIGLVHAWLDARGAREDTRLSRKRRANHS